MTQVMRSSTGVQWNAWNPDTMLHARRSNRPILLSIVTAWSEGCRALDRSTFADPDLVEQIHQAFCPIRVDADERPDVADRYELGGVPTIAFLSPSGACLGGGTFVTVQRLRAVLGRVAAAMERAGPAMPAVPSRAPSSASVAAPRDAELEHLVLATFDERYGGFGDAPKFPHTAPVHLALRLSAERGDATMRDRAYRTLDAMAGGALRDAGSGGFYRCCVAADWTNPQRDLLLGVNAHLLALYLEAAELHGVERCFARAHEIVQFIETACRRHDGAWRVSAGAAASRVLTDVNATAVSALLQAARVFDHTPHAARAIDALEHVLLAAYKPGEGVAHYAGGVRGLLTDQVAALAATLDAWDATGDVVYRMMAEELAHYALRVMWDEHDGGFFDRAPSLFAAEPSGAAGTLKPFVLNCQAAVALRRLSAATGDPAFTARAQTTLDAIASLAGAQGPDAAHYLLARRAVLR